MRLVLAVALLLAAACTSGGASPDDEAYTYVAVGASESVGVGADAPEREAWPRVFASRALPPGTRVVNVAESGASVREALERQLAPALEARPRLVTVWLNVNDLVRLVPVADYERDLGRLVHELRRDGRADVLVANTPPLELLPVVRACLPDPPPEPRCRLPVALPDDRLVVAATQAYNEAIARVVAREGAILVDLHAAAREAQRSGAVQGLIAADGFHPSTEGHRRVAERFAERLRSSEARELAA